ncbi:hypothetical protein MW887_003732 [Aspergillus wentii]|nr:hypothetical protein MW887_003732 [Aspergillus wentii]
MKLTFALLAALVSIAMATPIGDKPIGEIIARSGNDTDNKDIISSVGNLMISGLE